MIEINVKEKAAIAALKKIAKTWPDSLWLFSGSGVLYVMKKDDGKRAMTNGKDGGVDPDFTVAHINIESDGGDW